jgi:hypothetical protein
MFAVVVALRRGYASKPNTYRKEVIAKYIETTNLR